MDRPISGRRYGLPLPTHYDDDDDCSVHYALIAKFEATARPTLRLYYYDVLFETLETETFAYFTSARHYFLKLETSLLYIINKRHF